MCPGKTIYRKWNTDTWQWKEIMNSFIKCGGLLSSCGERLHLIPKYMQAHESRFSKSWYFCTLNSESCTHFFLLHVYMHHYLTFSDTWILRYISDCSHFFFFLNKYSIALQLPSEFYCIRWQILQPTNSDISVYRFTHKMYDTTLQPYCTHFRAIGLNLHAAKDV